MSEIESEPFVDEVLAQLQRDVAERLATLSSADESPIGVPAVESFEAAHVDFSSDSWRQHLLSVEGWLNLRSSLDSSSPTAFLTSLSDALGVSPDSPGDTPTPALLDELHSQADAAVHAQARFLEEVQGEDSTLETATARWRAEWEDNDTEENQSSEPVNAAADTWKVSEFVALAREGDINLAPSYQRSDVWALSARQMLIESILRGIPLPSIILLNDQDAGASNPYDVVDGRQRLTSILRFIGAHPTALAKVAEIDRKHEGHDLENLFRTDYPKFKKAWKTLEGQSLSAKLEETYYFPFRLRSGDQVMQGPLEALRGKYYCEIRTKEVQTAGGKEAIRKIFESTSQYKVPVIVYTKATPKQIHEVFNLYNKQGVHLNAEEIRNAIFHELELARAVLVASGDFVPRDATESIAPSLEGIDSQIHTLHEALEQYGLTAARYRRSKIVSWVIATLLHRPDIPAGKTQPRYASTAKHIDSLLQRVQKGDYPTLRKPDVLADLFSTFAAAAEVHASVDEEAWTTEFKQGTKWLDLQLVGTLVGVLTAAVVLGDELTEVMDASSDDISAAASTWKRPGNAQSSSQWSFVATVARGTAMLLGVDPRDAHATVERRFGASGLEALFSLADNSQDKPNL